ncbi:MAG TPA: S46 family peptidase [Cytophagaceae bacterium]
MMIRNIIIFAFTFSQLLSNIAKADEGMWLPLLIKRLNYTDMQKLGLKLTAEEIYDVNHSSLKDAVVNFGGFCTGEVISSEGLVLTNHHCGYESIQSHSTLESDYLTKGFWSFNKAQELPNAGLTVSFLIRMEDVTQQVKGSLSPETNPSEKDAKLEDAMKAIAAKAMEGSHYNAEVKSFFSGNEYYLFVYETYKDVRLVGAPPSAIGKFGGDTDNWMWPRHTGDFSLFRIYTGPDGKPAEYSTNNIPLKAKHYLPVSLNGVKKNDFTMVMGFPGNTERYLPSEGVKLALEQTNPARIKIREARLALMKQDMDRDPLIRIKYASNYAQVSNYYKYFIGQNQGLKRLKVIERKQKEEAALQDWIDKDLEKKEQFGNVLSEYKRYYGDLAKVNTAYVYLEEAAFGTEVLLFAYKLSEFHQALLSKDAAAIAAAKIEVQKTSLEFFKNYNAATDKKIFAALLQMNYNDVNKQLHPGIFAEVQKKYKGNFAKFADDVFSKSILVDQAKFQKFLANPQAKTLDKDLAFKTTQSIIGDFRTKIGPFIGQAYQGIENLNTDYTKAMMLWKKDAKLYPDANSTMRLSYGTVQDYFPRDAVYYNFYTTLDGIMEKEDSTSDEFTVPSKLKKLYLSKDFGQYVGENKSVPVCFITNNDITGGNSGSPVINGEGQIVGTAFDGNWEAMSGDIAFEPNLQRCIVTDIRYILFIIDKMAGAKNIIDELARDSQNASKSKNKEEKKIPVDAE